MWGDRVEEALDICLARVESGEASPEEALSAYPELRAELEPLLLLALELRSMPRVLAPESLRTTRRPLFIGREVPRVAPWYARAWVPSLARIAAGVALALLLLGGTVAASASSLPEEPLYPVKLVVENARLALTSDPRSRAELEIQFAARRLEEVEAAAQQGRVTAVERGLALYERQLEVAVQRIGTTGNAPPTTDPVIETSLARQQEQLAEVYDRAPAAAKPAILHAMEVSRKGIERSEGRRDGGSGGAADDKQRLEATPLPAAPVPTRAVPTARPGGDRDGAERRGKPSPSPTATAQPRRGDDGRSDDGERRRGEDGLSLNRGENGQVALSPTTQPPGEAARVATPTPRPWVFPSPTATPEAGQDRRDRRDESAARDGRDSRELTPETRMEERQRGDRDSREPSSRGRSR